MPDPTGSSFTDLLINQPVLVWSLAGGLSILVLAGFLSLFLSARKRHKQKKATELGPQKNVGREGANASDLASLAEQNLSATVSESETDTAVPTDATPIDHSSAENKAAANYLSSTDESAAKDFLTETVSAGGDERPSEPESIVEQKSELAAIFQDDVIVDPHLQALRDNLPAITIDELLSNLRSVSNELRHHINAEHVSQG